MWRVVLAGVVCVGGVAAALPASAGATRSRDRQAERALSSAAAIAERDAIDHADDYLPIYQTGRALAVLIRDGNPRLTVKTLALPIGITVRTRALTIVVCPRSTDTDLRLITLSRSGRVTQLHSDNEFITHSLAGCGIRKMIRVH